MPRLSTKQSASFLSAAVLVWTTHFVLAAPPQTPPAASAAAGLAPSFEQTMKPFLKENCIRCHNSDYPTSGVRVDHLDSGMEDRHLKLWENVRHRITDGTMPPKGQKQPTAEQRQQAVEWINKALEMARLRPTPKNGLVRRLTVAQYKNTLRELLMLEDDVADILPPDAVSKDGFVNNQETLQLSPLQVESYLDIAGEALARSIVDPKAKPRIQHFRMDLGASINKNPFPEELILGADSLLLDNKDFIVSEPAPVKPFAFEHAKMRTRYRFIEGYQGNDTVRGWREYDSIYHSVFACMRGKRGYPKGHAYSTVPEGLLLRPAIPSDELFGGDGTYGPRANFKISLRELPDHGRFRVTVTAAKYDDGLMLEPGIKPQASSAAGKLSVTEPKKRQTVTVAQPGIYQVDVYAGARNDKFPAPDSSRLGEGLGGSWTFDGDAGGGKLEGNAKFAESPFGEALSLDGTGDWLTVSRSASMSVGEGDFTVSAWVHPRQLRKGGLVALGAYDWAHGWYLDMPDHRGILRFESAGPDTAPNGSVSSPPGVIRANTWQHVVAVVRRKPQTTQLFVNGFLVARGQVGPANLDNPRMNLALGRLAGAPSFRGDLDEVRIYRRALGEAEIQALLEPGRKFAQPPPEKPAEVTLTLGGRQFSGILEQPAFAVVRLPAGPIAVETRLTGVRDVDRVVLTPLASADALAERFGRFEKRLPRVGVYLGFRRDCGSTLPPVGVPQTVKGTQLARYVFEGAIRNHPSPDVEKDNVNYLAGVREVGVRSEYTDGRDMPRLVVRSVEFEGPFYDSWPPAAHRNIFFDSPDQGESREYARAVIARFATRAYRRPVTGPEESSLMAVFDKSSSAGRGFQHSVKDALQVALTSPQFLFLTETSTTSKPEPLTQHELAAKLSYFLWNGPPDATTLRLASTGVLRSQLNSEVDRMVAHPRFSRFVREYASQWLALDKFSVLEPDRQRFPKLTRDNRTQLRREPIEYVDYLIRQNLPVRNLIASDFMLANEVVASYYDLGDKSESGFDFVRIPHGRRELGGVLTQAAIMAGLSDGRESNPVKRGAWLARRIVAEPPDDPPPNVPALKEDNAAQLTLRQRIEQHRNQPGCRQCHSKIDPWGIAFEEFDAGGRLKEKPADAQSKLPDGTEVKGAAELKRYLAEGRIDQVAFSALKHMATYGVGRTLAYNELDWLKREGLKLKPAGYRMKDMVRFVVNSPMFLEK